jgi:diguanylate cyclase (GGDEF)-like protein
MTDIDVLRRRIAELELELSRARDTNARLEALAHEDPLTQALNRRGFERELSRAVAFQRRYGTPIALLIFDIDEFKVINDRFGHAAGDAVLLTAAAVLRDNLRTSDTVARIGGDEFAALLWHIDKDQADLKGRRLVEQLAAATTTVDGGILRIKSSLGVTMLDGAGDVSAAYTRADRSLYLDKAARRAAIA